MNEPAAYDVLWSEAARQDLEHIVAFVSERNPLNAGRLWRKIEKRVGTLTSVPYRSRLVPELKAIGLDVYREIVIDPYRILLRVQGKKVYVHGIFDGRRDLEEILFQRLTR